MADIERLLVQEDQHHVGRKIAFYQKCLVEMPDEAIIGQNARVTLEVARTSQSGKTVYRAWPAPPIPSERWQDLGDGTASRQALETDWLGETSEVGTPEVRQLATREGTAKVRRDQQVVWGLDFGSTQVETTEVRVIPIETEKVVNNNLTWSKTGEREEPQPPKVYPAKSVELNTGCEWYRSRFDAMYSTEVSVLVDFQYQQEDAGVVSFSLSTNVLKWGNMPQWWRDEQEARWPLCSCGRKRYDAQNPDGYSKCEECRKEEVCVRCGQQKKATLVGGRLICEACQPYEEAEQWIHSEITTEGIQAIVSESEKLLRGQAVPQELGEKLLAATLEQTGWERSQTIEKWNGYHWYYFTEDGVWGSKLAPTAIELLSHLDEATGNGLVELVAWIAQGCGRPPRNIPDFYLWTQVEGKNFPVAEFDGRTEKDLCQYVQELANRISAGEPMLGVWLRESEGARLARVEHARILSAHLREHYSSCPICSHSISETESCLCVDANELPAGFEWEYDENGWEKSQVLRQTTYSGQEIARIEAIAGRRRNSSIVQVVVNQNPPQISDASQLKCVDFNWWVDETERARRERAKRKRQWQEKWAASCQQVESGQLLGLSFRKGRHPKTGEEQWEAGSRKVKYLLDRWCHHLPVEGLVYFCSLGKQLVNTGQFELWTVHIVPPYPEEAPEGFKPEAAEASDGEAEPAVVVEEDKGSVDPGALAALRAKFGGRR